MTEIEAQPPDPSNQDSASPAPEATPPAPAEPQAAATPDAPPPAADPVAPVVPAAVETPTAAPAPAQRPPRAQNAHLGTGRRKSAVARVRLMPGSGKIVINKRAVEQYFTQLKDQEAVSAPLKVTESAGRWDIVANVAGGGPTGQAGAIRLGLARALRKADASFDSSLRDAGFLTRDARRVERKKYGRRKARRSFQFSKR